MNRTGIGLAGVDGVWWLPAVEPFVLPEKVAGDLVTIGRSLFTFFDVVTDMYHTNFLITQLLNYKIPPHIPRLMGNGRFLSLRPDFQLCYTDDGVELVATELEICPSAHGFAHAMQVGYGLRPDLVEAWVKWLGGRPFLFVGTQQWSEFLWEQLAFCRALHEAGGRGYVLTDLPISQIGVEVRDGQRWQPPMFGIGEKTAAWDDDVYGRLQRHQLTPYLWPHDEQWPEDVGEAVVFRFGYFDCFAPEKLAYFARWQARGATLLNPAQFVWDSKVTMALLAETAVRQQLDAATLAILDGCIPETVLLTAAVVPGLTAEKDDWILKFAGYDSGNLAWGGRSLQIGQQHSAASWREVIGHYEQLPFPVVAQRVVPSAKVDTAYWGQGGERRLMEQGTTRLRVFLLREGATAVPCGAHLTVSAGTMHVSEATDAVQAPVYFAPSLKSITSPVAASTMATSPR